MKFDEQFMKNAIIRINELQEEVATQALHIQGAQEYVKKQVELFKQEEALNRQYKFIQKEAQKVSNDFFLHNAKFLNNVE